MRVRERGTGPLDGKGNGSGRLIHAKHCHACVRVWLCVAYPSDVLMYSPRCGLPMWRCREATCLVIGLFSRVVFVFAFYCAANRSHFSVRGWSAPNTLRPTPAASANICFASLFFTIVLKTFSPPPLSPPLPLPKFSQSLLDIDKKIGPELFLPSIHRRVLEFARL